MFFLIRAIVLELNYGTAEFAHYFRNNGASWSTKLHLERMRLLVAGFFLASPKTITRDRYKFPLLKCTPPLPSTPVGITREICIGEAGYRLANFGFATTFENALIHHRWVNTYPFLVLIGVADSLSKCS